MSEVFALKHRFPVLLPDITFDDDSDERLTELKSRLQQLSTLLDTPSSLRQSCREVSRIVRGETPDSVGVTHIKCAHNHLALFRWQGRTLVHKSYGNPWGCLRECLTRRFLAERGLGHVDAPLCLDLIDTGHELFVASAFVMHEGAPQAPNHLAPHAYRQLGSWTRRLHECTKGYQIDRRMAFCLSANRMLDLTPVLNSSLADPSHWELVETVSRRLLEELDDQGTALIHNDLGTAGNILFRQGSPPQLSWVLDFEFAQIGYRCMDFLWIYREYPGWIGAFCSGYGVDDVGAMTPVLSLWSSLVEIARAMGYNYSPNQIVQCACPKSHDNHPATASPAVRQRFEDHCRLLDRLL